MCAYCWILNIPSAYTQTLTALVARSFFAAIVRNTLWFMDAGPIITVVDGARVVVIVTANVFKYSIPEFVEAEEDKLAPAIVQGVILSRFELVVQIFALMPCFAVTGKARSSSRSRRSCLVLSCLVFSSRCTHAAIVLIAIDEGPALVAVVEHFTLRE